MTSIMAVSNCDVSTIFNGGAPNNAGASVVIGGKQLIPSPFINLSLEKYKIGDLTIGGVLKLTLNGNVVGSSFDEVVTTGAGGVTGLKDILQIGQYKECVDVEIKCTETMIKGYGRVTGLSINEGNMPTWVNMAPYTIEIDLYSNDIGLSNGERPAYPGQIEQSSSTLNGLMLNSVSEQFSLSINDDTFNWAGGDYPTQMPDWPDFGGWGNRHIKVSFSISAAGIRGLNNCNNGDLTGFEFGLKAAETYIRDRIEKLRDMNVAGVFNAPTTELNQAFLTYRGGLSFLDFRNIDVNPIENSISLSGEIIYRPSGCSGNTSVEDNVFSTLNVEQSLDAEGETITLTGNIQGLVNNDFDKIIKMSSSPINNSFSHCGVNEKISHASLFLYKLAKEANLKKIANYYYNNEGFFDTQTDLGYLKDNCALSSQNDVCVSSSPSPSPGPNLCDLRLTSSQINRNLSQGEINFTFVLSNKANCSVLGTKKIDVEITHDIPHDNIVEFLIPGRGDKGVITQNLCCKSSERYDININAVLNNNNCNFTVTTTAIDNLRKCAEDILDDLAQQEGINFDCWFNVNNQETTGNNTFRIARSYVKPSCP